MSSDSSYGGVVEVGPGRWLIRDHRGLPVSYSPVCVYDYQTNYPAAIFANKSLATALPNPVTTDEQGTLAFFARRGRYDLSVTVAGVAMVYTVEVDDFLYGAKASAALKVIARLGQFLRLCENDSKPHGYVTMRNGTLAELQSLIDAFENLP